MVIIILYGGDGISDISWGLFDGSTLAPYKTKDGKLHLGQASRNAKSNIIYTVSTSDVLDKEKEAQNSTINNFRDNVTPQSQGVIKQETTEEQKPLPSWDLRNWGMTKEQVNKPISNTPSKTIEQAINEQYGNIFSVESALKIDNRNIVQKLLTQEGMDPFTKLDVFLVELGDADEGDSLYGLFVMCKNGKIRQINIPTNEEGNKPLVVDPVSMKGPDGNNYTVRW